MTWQGRMLHLHACLCKLSRVQRFVRSISSDSGPHMTWQQCMRQHVPVRLSVQHLVLAPCAPGLSSLNF